MQIMVKFSAIAAIFLLAAGLVPVSCTSKFGDIPNFDEIPKNSEIRYCKWAPPNGTSRCDALGEVGEEFCADFGGEIVAECSIPSSSSTHSSSSSSIVYVACLWNNGTVCVPFNSDITLENCESQWDGTLRTEPCE
jgi:hypothetical protein